MRDARRHPPPKLLDTVRQVLRLYQGTIHTERSSVEWIVQFVRFHGLRSRDEPLPPNPRSSRS
jgi:hypothetical protein